MQRNVFSEQECAMLVKHMLEVPSDKRRHRHEQCNQSIELSTTSNKYSIYGPGLTTIFALDMPAAP